MINQPTSPEQVPHTIKNNLGLPDEFIMPDYKGGSILNIPSTICRLFDIPPISNSALPHQVFPAPSPSIKRIILILMDGLSINRFQNWIGNEDFPLWKSLIQSGQLSTLTSICPSTTSAAMTTLWTGKSPAEHGVMGYEVWLKQYGVVTNMITQSPMSFNKGYAGLDLAGFDAETELKMPKLGEHLVANGIHGYSFQHYSIANSGLSRTFMQSTKSTPYINEAECWLNLQQLIQSNPTQRQYIWTYWSGLDSLGHLYGPDDQRAYLYFKNFTRNLEDNLINRLSPQQRHKTLIILTSDHGQVTTFKNPHYEVRNHPDFLDCLHIKPTGESRFTYLHVRPGQEQTLRQLIQTKWQDQFVLIRSRDALHAGLFGPGDPMPDIYNRIGDFILLARDDHYIWWGKEENPLIGRHGGLSPSDMLVPFLVVAL